MVVFGVNTIAGALATDPIIPIVAEMVRILLSANSYSYGNDPAACKKCNVKIAVVAPSRGHGDLRTKHLLLRCYENSAPRVSDQITTSALPPKKFDQ